MWKCFKSTSVVFLYVVAFIAKHIRIFYFYFFLLFFLVRNNLVIVWTETFRNLCLVTIRWNTQLRNVIKRSNVLFTNFGQDIFSHILYYNIYDWQYWKYNMRIQLLCFLAQENSTLCVFFLVSICEIAKGSSAFCLLFNQLILLVRWNCNTHHCNKNSAEIFLCCWWH